MIANFCDLRYKGEILPKWNGSSWLVFRNYNHFYYGRLHVQGSGQ